MVANRWWLGSAPAALGVCLTFAGCTETPLGDIEISCNDSEIDIYGPPPSDGSKEKGAVYRCAPYRTLTAQEMDARLVEGGRDTVPTYTSKPLASGAKVYRIAYRTERGTSPPTPGTSVALVYLPDNPITDKLPIIVASRGSRGQAPQCAPSLFSADGEYVRGDFEAQVLPFVGAGYAVIAPDLAGYSNYGAAGNPPSAYANAQDIARSVLDASRALRNLIPGRVSDKVVLIGHSQGGHSALASLALSPSYGSAGTIVAVATYAPLWINQRSWGGLFALENDYKLGQSAALPASIWYHYTAGELLDGPGGGLAPFKDSVRSAIKEFNDTQCWAAKYPKLEALGSVASDFFTSEFKDAVTAAAGFGGDCPTSPPEQKAICEKWIPRYKADRPAITGDAAKVPILVAIGGKDTTIPVERLKCVADNLDAQKLPVSYCVNANADHGGIVRAEAFHVVDWVSEKVLGTVPKESCPSSVVKFTDDKGQDVTCPAIPPND